jgi:predicted component of type VI protein secretion system
MLVVEAIAVRGQPLSQPLRAAFDESGGTIGRGATCTLVLPDPERRVSRTHATIGFDARGYVLTDTGSFDRLALNGRTLRGTHAALKDGDKLTVGPYRLVVRFVGVPSAVAPAQISPAATTDVVEPLNTTPSSPDEPQGVSQSDDSAPQPRASSVSSEPAKEDTLVAIQEQLASAASKELDLVLSSRDARIEPRLQDDGLIERPTAATASQDADALGLYPFFAVEPAAEHMPENGERSEPALCRSEPPLLTSVWDPTEEQAEVDATVYAGAQPTGAASPVSVEQLEAILRAAGVTGITHARLERLVRVLQDPTQSRQSPARRTPVRTRVRKVLSNVMVHLGGQRQQFWLKRESPLDHLLPMTR